MAGDNPSAKRKRKNSTGGKNHGNKKGRAKNDKLFDFTGILLIAVGILILISLLSQIFSDTSTIAGKLGDAVGSLFIILFGMGAYVVPFIFVFMGICYIKYDKYFNATKKSVGVMMFIIVTMLFIEMVVLKVYYSRELGLGSAVMLQSRSNSILNGGIIALLIDVPLFLLIGKIGSFVVFLALYIISLALIFNITIKELFTFEKVEKEKKGKNDKRKESAGVRSIDITGTSDEAAYDKDAEKGGGLEGIKIFDFMKDSENASDGEEEKRNEMHEKLEPAKKEKAEFDEERDGLDIPVNTLEYEYQYPSPELLKKQTANVKNGDKKELLNSANKLQDTLASFGVDAKVVQVTKGPSVTRFELQPHVGVKVSKIVNLADDIALNLAASGVRIEAPIPGKAAVGIEVPNKELSAVLLREVIESEEFKSTKKNLAFVLGKDIGGNCVVGDLTKMPHLLIAGATGSGKSVCINTLLMSLIYKYSPEDVRLLLVDPKVVELNVYNGIPHLLIPVVTDAKKAAGALYWAVNEMTRRYKLFADNNVRNIEGYNEFVEKGVIEEKLPWIVIIIDELADLMMVCPGEVEEYIARLAQMARAAGMHLVIATQRPSVDVITGVIKANIPSRISFAVSSQIDSRTILDSSGAEKLLGKGDMLYYPVGESKPIRIQGAFVSEEEVEAVVNFVCQGVRDLDYKVEIMEEIENSASREKGSGDDSDELLDRAIQIVMEEGQASTSMLQRRLKIGYNRAARIIDQMEEEGIVSGKNGSKPRQVLGRDDYS